MTIVSARSGVGKNDARTEPMATALGAQQTPEIHHGNNCASVIEQSSNELRRMRKAAQMNAGYNFDHAHRGNGVEILSRCEGQQDHDHRPRRIGLWEWEEFLLTLETPFP